MKKYIKLSILSIALGVSMIVGFSLPAAAACGSVGDCINQGLHASGADSTPLSIHSLMGKITNILLFLMGSVSVIMIIIGGFRYVTSQGDQTQVQSAKNTILYSIVGIVVAILAYAAVNFVVSSFVKSE
mgnify:CR=1 FL=1